MNIQFCGAAQVVTGSKHLITTSKGIKILLDCGLFQGSIKETDPMNHNFGFIPSEINFLILSHAHIDHSGLIPRLVGEGFNGIIYATAATKDLCEIMLLDSAKIQVSDIKNVNERRKKRGEAEILPLYNSENVTTALYLFKPVEYRQWININNEISFYFSDTGHILGSAAISLKIIDNGIEKHIFFSGDIGRPNDKILRSPEIFPQADFIICESTYGDKLHEPEDNVKARLLDLVRQTCVEKKGKLIIPAFSVDRTQELIYALDQLATENKLPDIPVFIDSPLSVKATGVMEKHEECFNPEILAYIKKDGNAFEFPNLHYVSEVEDSKKINLINGPCIIISSSGMAEAGRIKHHIKNNIDNAANTILLVGYCTPSSLGGALKRGEKIVTIFDEEHEVKANVAVMDSFSAHADYKEIIEFLNCQDKEKIQKIFLVHGEKPVQDIFKYRLIENGFNNVEIPERFQIFEL